MRIALVQHDIAWEDAAATQARLVPLLAQAASGGARLIALTEMFAKGFSMDVDTVAEPQGGPTEQFLLHQAATLGCWLVGSIAQRPADAVPGSRAQNVAVLAGPDGSVHRYAKIHPFSYSGEDKHYAGGTEFLTVEIEGVRLSIFVCYDLRFADEFWALADRTDCYVVVANWPENRRNHWNVLLRARAIENQAYVAAVNRVGTVGRLSYVGDSVLIDPFGLECTEPLEGEGVLFGDIDPERVINVRAKYPFLADRR
ncbi:MAG: putative carbon-nitrogen hydrolase [Pseudonocardiales bacterium]|nr:putative carbon-nitrogen hydrolase [Pseudonocardiales bacterium]